MDFPISINGMSPFPILKLLVVFFLLYSIFIRNFCKQTVNISDRFAASDMVLHCLPMSHKKNARLI